MAWSMISPSRFFYAQSDDTLLIIKKVAVCLKNRRIRTYDVRFFKYTAQYINFSKFAEKWHRNWQNCRFGASAGLF